LTNPSAALACFAIVTSLARLRGQTQLLTHACRKDTMLHQARGVRAATFDATVSDLRQSLDSAERQARLLAQNSVLPQLRGFSDAFDSVRAALSSLEATRGAMLRRASPTL
jgi:hypothetical protein